MKEFRGRFLRGFIVITLLCCFLPTHVQGQQKVIKLGTVLPDDNFLTQNAREFARLVNEKSGSRIKIEVYPASQLGGERDQAEGLQLGTQEMTLISTGVLSAFAPEIGVFGLPFIFKSWDHLDKALLSKTAEKLKEDVIKKSGIRPLVWLEQGFRITITNGKAINRLNDMKGMKIRVPEDRILMRTFQLLGASPTVIPWGEVYTALQTNVVVGMESTPTGIESMRFMEVSDYIAITNHQHAVCALLISDRLFKSLSLAEQAIIQAAADEVSKINFAQAYKAAKNSQDNLSKQAVLTTEPDLTEFQKAVDSIYEEFGKQTNTLSYIRDIQALK
jgi:tripartite ATP-independent transporter DctP family solute receptor